MSAYVVDDSTINRIVSYFYTKSLGDRFYWPNRTIEEAGYNLEDKTDRERLANDMFALNVRAVNGRYGEGQAAEFRPLDFQYMAAIPPQTIGAYKALDCLLYQCSERDVPNSDLYKMLWEVKVRLACEIVDNLPQYNRESWG